MTKDDSCSVCRAADFKRCDCPWHLPFDAWGPIAKAALRKALGHE